MIRRNHGYIAVARHRSYWDIPILVAALGWPNRIHFIARKGLMRKMPMLAPFFRMFTTVIDRDRFRLADYRRLRAAVLRERLIGIFPEGTTRKRVDPKAGAVRFARISGKPLLPVSIRPRGPYPPHYPVRFPQVTVTIGEPITVEDLETAASSPTASGAEAERALIALLMERVDAVTP
jgi:1-acyl-sn-glycerol-3-phosphate acyltransferase